MWSFNSSVRVQESLRSYWTIVIYCDSGRYTVKHNLDQSEIVTFTGVKVVRIFQEMSIWHCTLKNNGIRWHKIWQMLIIFVLFCTVPKYKVCQIRVNSVRFDSNIFNSCQRINGSTNFIFLYCIESFFSYFDDFSTFGNIKQQRRYFSGELIDSTIWTNIARNRNFVRLKKSSNRITSTFGRRRLLMKFTRHLRPTRCGGSSPNRIRPNKMGARIFLI